jgi:hypothetical protein
VFGVPRPDLVLKNRGPASDDKKPKAFLVSEFKISQKSASRAWRGKQRKQFNAIRSYAQLKNGHQFVPIASLVTFYGGGDIQRRNLQKMFLAVRPDESVFLDVRSILPGKR